MDITQLPDSLVFAFVILCVRVIFGLLFAAHGTQKLFGWFQGPGLDGTAAFLEQLGLRPGRAFAIVAGLTETSSGFLIALGLLGPVGPALVLSVMTTAVITIHWGNGLLQTSNGIELPLLYSTVAVSLALLGFGAFSADALVGLSIWPGPVLCVVLLAGVLGGVANTLVRRAPVLHA